MPFAYILPRQAQKSLVRVFQYLILTIIVVIIFTPLVIPITVMPT